MIPKGESLSILLLDKDRIMEPFLPASDSDFIIKKPTEHLFNDCCNEFWWIYPYGDDERVTAHLKHVKDLPRDAMEMYE